MLGEAALVVPAMALRKRPERMMGRRPCVSPSVERSVAPKSMPMKIDAARGPCLLEIEDNADGLLSRIWEEKVSSSRM